EIDQLPIQIGNQLWGDLGKYLGNPGFIRGAFHQLDFINDLRTARKTVESIEEGFGFIKDSQNVKRRIDVVADSGRHFEVKNFSNYGKANVDTVINGLEKELGRIL